MTGYTHEDSGDFERLLQKVKVRISRIFIEGRHGQGKILEKVQGMVRGDALKKRLERIAADFRLKDIYVFGSRAEEIARRLAADSAPVSTALFASDVDIAVRPSFGLDLSPRERVDLTAVLEDLLEAPRVDLVMLPEADPFLALEVIRGELLYTADPDDQAWYELFVLRRAGDLMAWKKERIRMIFKEGAR